MNKVSILIPVYNREKYIEECVESALNQIYLNIEVIIVDNASTDNTWNICQKLALQDKRIRIFKNESNIGPVKNWKRCIDEATGMYGKILWSDDLIAPAFLSKTIPLLDDDVGFIYTGTKIFTDEPDKGKKNYFLDSTGLYSAKMFIVKSLYENTMPVSPGCAVFRLSDLRKNLFVDIPNKVNSNFSMHAIGNDLLIFLLTANDYKKFGFVAESLSFFRAHEGSISVSSTSGKLPLHYALTKAYFVENYLPVESRCFASFIQALLWRFKDSSEYSMMQVDDFFSVPVKPCFSCYVKKIVGVLRHFARKILGK